MDGTGCRLQKIIRPVARQSSSVYRLCVPVRFFCEPNETRRRPTGLDMADAAVFACVPHFEMPCEGSTFHVVVANKTFRRIHSEEQLRSSAERIVTDAMPRIAR